MQELKPYLKNILFTIRLSLMWHHYVNHWYVLDGFEIKAVKTGEKCASSDFSYPDYSTKPDL